MPVTKDRRNGRWRFAFMFQGRRYSGSAPLSANTKRRAQELEDDLRAKVEAGKFTGAAPTIAGLVERFLAFESAHNSASTVRARRIHLVTHVVPTLGDLRADHLDKARIDALVVAWRSAGAEPPTCNARLNTLRRMLGMAVEWGLLSSVPKFKRLRCAEGTPRFLTEDEATRLLEAMPEEWRSMGLVALRTGLRIGELRALRWGDVDGAARTIRVRRTDPGRGAKGGGENAPKGKRDRTVPMTPDATDALARLWAAAPADRRGPADRVWPGKASRTLVDYDRGRSENFCTVAIDKAARAAGIQGEGDAAIGWHTLRHTYASWLVMRGVSLRVIQKLLGHAKIETTEIYAHLSPTDTLHAEVDSLDLRLVKTERKELPAMAGEISTDDGKRGSGQPAPHETQQGADTPGHRASEAAGNVADPHPRPDRPSRRGPVVGTFHLDEEEDP